MKYCRKCNEWKELSAFPSDVSRKDGKHPYCTACKVKAHTEYIRGKGRETTVARRKRYEEENRNKITEQRRVRRQTEEGKRQRIEAQKRYRSKDPRKYLARAQVQYEVQTGKRPRARDLPCAYCGKPAKEYHHHKGYEKKYWRDVIPVCGKCHNKITVSQTTASPFASTHHN